MQRGMAAASSKADMQRCHLNDMSVNTQEVATDEHTLKRKRDIAPTVQQRKKASVLKACDRCRRHKQSCEGGIPCMRCERVGLGGECMVGFSRRGLPPPRNDLVNKQADVWWNILQKELPTQMPPRKYGGVPPAGTSRISRMPPFTDEHRREVLRKSRAEAAAAASAAEADRERWKAHLAKRVRDKLFGSDAAETSVTFLATGGSSVVFKCRDALGNVFAVKATMGGRQLANTTLIKEYLILRKLEGHAWVPKLLECRSKGDYALVQCMPEPRSDDVDGLYLCTTSLLRMEYISPNRFTSESSFWSDEGVTFNFVLQFCESILTMGSELYGLGFEHRDIKPGNILWSTREPVKVMMLDCGGTTTHLEAGCKTIVLGLDKGWEEAIYTRAIVGDGLWRRRIDTEEFADYRDDVVDSIRKPIWESNNRNIGSYGTPMYRCAGDGARRQNCNDSWAIGVMMLMACTAGCSSIVAKRMRRLLCEERAFTSEAVDVQWTRFLQDTVRMETSSWIALLGDLWRELPLGVKVVSQEKDTCKRKVCCVHKALRRLLLDHRPCSYVLERWNADMLAA